MTFSHKGLYNYLTLFSFNNRQRALDHEGWAVGVAALWGYYTNSITANDVAPPRTITSAEVSKLEVCKSTVNRQPIF